MKRRDLLKSVPATVLLPTALGSIAGNVIASDKKTAGSGGGDGSQRPPAQFFRTTDKTLGDLDAYEGLACDQFGVDGDGKPVADNLTGTGSDASPGVQGHKMKLTPEEQDILNGSKGAVMAKVLKTIVKHGELFGAERLADCGGAPHSSLYTGSPWVTPVLEMFEEIAAADLKAHAPYTVNPMPIDLYRV